MYFRPRQAASDPSTRLQVLPRTRRSRVRGRVRLPTLSGNAFRPLVSVEAPGREHPPWCQQPVCDQENEIATDEGDESDTPCSYPVHPLHLANVERAATLSAGLANLEEATFGA